MQMLTAGDLHTNIEEQVINPTINNEIDKLLKSRNKWRKISNISETVGNLLIVVATILTFANGVYNCNSALAFSAGCVNVASISILKFSTYSAGESSERNRLLNELLIRVNVQPLPHPINNSPTYFY